MLSKHFAHDAAYLPDRRVRFDGVEDRREKVARLARVALERGEGPSRSRCVAVLAESLEPPDLLLLKFGRDLQDLLAARFLLVERVAVDTDDLSPSGFDLGLITVGGVLDVRLGNAGRDSLEHPAT